MFCVIQQIQLKKPNRYGAYKDYEVKTLTWSLNGRTYNKYSYEVTAASERFERPHREAYRVSLHESYREGGKVKKRQYVVCTVNWYELVDWGYYEAVESGLKRLEKTLQADFEALYQLIEAKLEPIWQAAKQEFKKTPEYKAEQKRRKLTDKWSRARSVFAKKYHIDADEYDHCFNVFGDLMDPAYLEEIKKQAEVYENYSSYANDSRSTYGSGSSYRSYFEPTSNIYTDDEKQRLKKFYKKLAMEFHPDKNPEADTTQEMQLLNKLKDDWGV